MMALWNSDQKLTTYTGMKMSRKVLSFYMAVLLTLSSVYAAQRSLNSIEELTICHLFKHTNILALLHWFATEVHIDQSNVIRLTFNPSTEYGSHRYRNDEGILDHLPTEYQYYTVGNINRETSKPLPTYVVNTQQGSTEWNKARIIFRVREGKGHIIDQVYITQHYDLSEGHGSTYDPEHTYSVTVNLLRELSSCSFNEIQRLARGFQTGHSGNQANSDHQRSINSDRRDSRISLSRQHTRRCRTCGWIVCAIVFSAIIIMVTVLMIFYGAARK